MLACKEEGYVLKGQNSSLQPLMSPLSVLELKGEPEMGVWRLQSAALLFFFD